MVRITNRTDRWCWMSKHAIPKWNWCKRNLKAVTLTITRYHCRTREIKCKGSLACLQCSPGHTMTWIPRKFNRQRSAQMDSTVQRWVSHLETGMEGMKVNLSVEATVTEKKNEITSQYQMVGFTQKLTFSLYKTGNRLVWWLQAIKMAVMDSTKRTTMNQTRTNSVKIRKGQILCSQLPRTLTLTRDLRPCQTSSSQAINFRTEW